jgi:pimeloyl-ACP methyl ester carboxylesterase
MVYVLVPGAWAADWIWDETASRLRGFGHTVHALTLSGLGGTGDAADVDLSIHVQDVLDHIRARDLDRVVLVGHSYAGVVVGQVAASAPDLVAHTVYVNAFLPDRGQCRTVARAGGAGSSVRGSCDERARTRWGSAQAALLHALSAEPTWTFVTMGGGHWPMLTVPDELVAHLLAAHGPRRPEPHA